MKIMMSNNTYSCHPNPSHPCQRCVLKLTTYCQNIPSVLCIEGGGFQFSDTKIFTL
jgi:hypothetical protein